MPNTEVKLLHAESSWWETACEDRKLPREGKVRRKSGFFVLSGAAKRMCTFYSTTSSILIIGNWLYSTTTNFLIFKYKTDSTTVENLIITGQCEL